MCVCRVSGGGVQGGVVGGQRSAVKRSFAQQNNERMKREAFKTSDRRHCFDIHSKAKATSFHVNSMERLQAPLCTLIQISIFPIFFFFFFADFPAENYLHFFKVKIFTVLFLKKEKKLRLLFVGHAVSANLASCNYYKNIVNLPQYWTVALRCRSEMSLFRLLESCSFSAGLRITT